MNEPRGLNQTLPRVLSDEQLLQLKELRDMESDFIHLCSKIGRSRELSLAITNMEQAAFWACRHVQGPD